MQNADDRVVFSASMVSLQKLMAIVLIFFILIFLSMEAYLVMQTSLNSVEFIILFFFTFYTFSNYSEKLKENVKCTESAK